MAAAAAGNSAIPDARAQVQITPHDHMHVHRHMRSGATARATAECQQAVPLPAAAIQIAAEHVTRLHYERPVQHGLRGMTCACIQAGCPAMGWAAAALQLAAEHDMKLHSVRRLQHCQQRYSLLMWHNLQLYSLRLLCLELLLYAVWLPCHYHYL